MTLDGKYVIGAKNRPYDLVWNPRRLTQEDLYAVFDVEIEYGAGRAALR